MPAIKTATADGADQSIHSAVSKAGELAHREEFADAHALLDTVEDLLAPQSGNQSEAVTGTGVPLTEPTIDNSAPGELGQAKEPGSGEERPEEAGLNLAELQEWLDDLHAQAALLPAPGGADLLARAKALHESLASADLQTSADDVEALAKDIALANRAARIAEAQAQSGDRVTRTRLQRQWQQAQEQAHATLEGFVASLLANPALQQDERYPRLQAAEGVLTSLIPDDRGLLENELADVDEASDPDEIRAVRDRATSALKAYSSRLEQGQDLRELQELADQEYDGAPFLKPLQQSLAALSTQLEKRA